MTMAGWEDLLAQSHRRGIRGNCTIPDRCRGRGAPVHSGPGAAKAFLLLMLSQAQPGPTSGPGDIKAILLLLLLLLHAQVLPNYSPCS